MELTAVQGRVIGCLVEKERTVPESYPLTLNALLSACNQSSNRSPVVDYGEHEVVSALDELKAAGMVRFVFASHGARSTRYRQVAGEGLGLEPEPLAVLAVLLLRGPQTAAELRARTERLHAFTSVSEVEQVLGALAARPDPLAVRLERQPGQKEERWVQVLTGPPDLAALSTGTPATAARADRVAELEAALAELTAELARVRERVARLEAELGLAAG